MFHSKPWRRQSGGTRKGTTNRLSGQRNGCQPIRPAAACPSMNEGELDQWYAALDVQPGATPEELERAYLKKNFGLLKGRTGSATEANIELEAQRRALRDAYDRILA